MSGRIGSGFQTIAVVVGKRLTCGRVAARIADAGNRSHDPRAIDERPGVGGRNRVRPSLSEPIHRNLASARVVEIEVVIVDAPTAVFRSLIRPIYVVPELLEHLSRVVEDLVKMIARVRQTTPWPPGGDPLY